MYECPEIGTSVILNLYRKHQTVSIPCFIATKSAPKTDVSIVGYFLDGHWIKDIIVYIIKPILDLRFDDQDPHILSNKYPYPLASAYTEELLP